MARFRLSQCVLRLGLYERDAERAVSWPLLAGAHDLRRFTGKKFRRKIYGVANGAERGEPASLARQQPDVRRIPL